MGLRQLFRRLSLDLKLIASYLVILGVGGLAISVVGSWIVSTTIWREAQRTVSHDLAIARAIYDQRLELVTRTVEASAAATTVPSLLAAGDPAALAAHLDRIARPAGLDLLGVTDARGRVVARAAGGEPAAGGPAALGVVSAALAGDSAAATERLTAGALAAESAALAARSRLALVDAHGAPVGGIHDDALLLAAAAPVRDANGELVAVLYGAVLVNGNLELVDDVRRRLFPGGEGAVTIFAADVRVATNVENAAGERALGTRVSDAVRAAVLERGEIWHDRAQVVDRWYISAYEPIRDAAGERVGMLYVGLLEDTYAATRDRVIGSFFAIATLGFALVLAVTYWIIQSLTRPIRQLVEATRSVAAGRFDHRLEIGAEGELGLLAESFEQMQSSLTTMRRDLEESARTLEDKVRARSEELVKMQARMAQSERLASIGVLAAGVAHEINNPLGGILALTSLCLEDLQPDDPALRPIRENLEEVVRQSRRCGEIVRHLLEFSRQHQLSAEPVDVEDLLERTLALLERQSMFMNVRVERRLAGDLPRILADRSQLQQVFMNILINAVQAMEQRGSITLESRYDRERDRVELRFRDTGHGIPADRVDRIFDPFFTTKESGQGTGLGLSIAYGIVSRHHGSIAVESEVGVGTTFTVRLPASAQFQPAPALLGGEPVAAGGEEGGG